jgi:hypothetical protein
LSNLKISDLNKFERLGIVLNITKSKNDCMTGTKNIIFVFILLLSSYCRSGLEIILTTGDITRVINIPDSIPKEPLSRLFSHVEYVKLESSERSQIGVITKALIDNDRIYIFDNIQKCLLCFDVDGKYISRYQNLGNGPGEYKTIHDFDLLPDRKGVVLLADYDKILLLDRELKFQKGQKTMYKASSLAALTQDIFAFYTAQWEGIVNGDTANQYNLVINNIKSREAAGLFPNQLSKRLRFGGEIVFYRSDALIYLNPIHYNGYFVSEKGVDSTWYFDFNKRKFNDEELNRLNSSKDRHNLLTANPGKVGGIRNVYLKGNLIFFEALESRGASQSIISRQYFFNINSKEICSGLYNDLSDLKMPGFFLGSFNGGFFAQIPAHLLKLPGTMVIPESLKDIEITDNPIIAFYYAKK